MYEKVRQEDYEKDEKFEDFGMIGYTSDLILPNLKKTDSEKPKTPTRLQQLNISSSSRKAREDSLSEIYRNNGLSMSRPSTSPSFETMGSYFQKQGPKSRPNSRASTPYHMPESPVRKGLSPHAANNDMAFSSKVFFESLPDRPLVPDRLEPADIVRGNCYDLGYDPEESKLIFEAIANKEVKMLEREGYIKNGKNTIGILERAERVYLPVKSQGDFYSSSLEKISKNMLNMNEQGEDAMDASVENISNRRDNAEERKILGGDLDEDDNDLSFQPSTFSFEDVTGISQDLLQNFGSIHDFSNLDNDNNSPDYSLLKNKPKVSYAIELLLP